MPLQRRGHRPTAALSKDDSSGMTNAVSKGTVIEVVDQDEAACRVRKEWASERRHSPECRLEMPKRLLDVPTLRGTFVWPHLGPLSSPDAY